MAFAVATTIVSIAQVNTEQVMRIGQNALYFEDYMLSIQYFNQVIVSKPYLAQPYFYRAIAKLNLDDFAGAEKDADIALELNPFLSDAYEVRGVARHNQGKERAAIEDYNQALQLLPRNRSLLFNRGLAQTHIKDYQAAKETFDEILRYYPKFENAYLGRARVLLETQDTISALSDIEKAIALNKNALNAYIMRADISINSEHDYERARSDINEAIRLQPRMAGLYINRAFLNYNLDSYKEAMSDYDYALTLEPTNTVALFNRGLLLMEVSANDLALDDFNSVLVWEPENFQALYNRAVVLQAKGDIEGAIADINKVIERFPEFPSALFMRSALNKSRGKLTQADADYKKAMALAKALTAPESEGEDAKVGEDSSIAADPTKIAKKFATLVTINDNADLREEYNNTAIRGRIQDRNLTIEIEPMMLLSFYSSPTELRQNTYYLREVDDVNATRVLRFVLVVTNAVPTLDEIIIKRHFQSIEYYNSYLATHDPRPIDYIGRALDFLTVRDYANAMRDANRAIELAPDLTLAYFIRSQARYLETVARRSTATNEDAMLHKAELAMALEDIDKAIELSPRTAIAYFNKGNLLMEIEDFEGAESAYTKAIECKSDLGEAYFNRGYIALKQGRQIEGVADLSKAGELGIVSAYNLIKRISK